jgi:uncharacterized membrane-anchored protein YitT (DUF2179 family)
MKEKGIRIGYQLVVMLVALEVLAVSINMFYAPHNVAAGGATGISILLEEAVGWNRALVVFVINIFMLLASYLTLGKETTARITVGSLLLPVCMAITPSVSLVTDRTLAIVVGGALYAVGVALLYQIDASSGGTTVPPLILKKYFNFKPAVSLLVIDTLVCVMNIFSSGIEAFILALFSSVITLMVMNYIETGIDRKKSVYIMSSELAKIEEIIAESLDQSYTSLDVQGGFSGDNKRMLMLVIENSEYHRIIERIHQVDPQAFILTTNVAEVHGGQM